MKAPGAEIVAIGTELLLGEIHETNGTWLGKALAAAGIAVRTRTVIGDDEAGIRSVVDEALRRTGVVICTGNSSKRIASRQYEAMICMQKRPAAAESASRTSLASPTRSSAARS